MGNGAVRPHPPRGRLAYPRAAVATQRSKPRSRKRRHSRSSASAAAGSVRREQGGTEASTARTGDQPRVSRRRASPFGAYGERPQSPFGGLPISELAILGGAVALVVGVIRQGGPALIGGLILCVLGVTEVTAREHFSGYRSHTVLLAAVPAVVAEFVITLTVGAPRVRVLLLVPVAAVFAACAWLLRRRFLVARQGRLARPLKR
jgi:hypothetical protein